MILIRRSLLLLVTLTALTPSLSLQAAASEPVTFVFKLSGETRDPFARELWAEVNTPSGRTLRLPAYFAGRGRFAVRARADENGVYSLGSVLEKNEEQLVPVEAKISGEAKQAVPDQRPRPAVGIDGANPTRFVLSDGREYVPIGANLAWAPAGRLRFYGKAFREFNRQQLNWTRIWMCHWGRLNLDWGPTGERPAKARGVLNLDVASDWDRILREAEANGVYVQVVLQHHGQYSTGANPNWASNPWNIANGGFLKTPAEFFTSPEARRLTKQKYRYIVARWGYSPAVLAWELFNEVHWVDALSKDRDVAAVAAWHDEMAAHIRSLDVYRHLITTSTDDLHSPIYASMDYLQPHLYAPNMIAAPMRIDAGTGEMGRPIFYGEVGEDNMRVTDALKKSGALIVPPVWPSLMGESTHPAQPWLGAELIAAKRLDELGAVARFVAAMNTKPRGPMARFSPVIQTAAQQPLVLVPGQHWQRRPPAVITIPPDGRYTSAIAELPHFIVGAPESIADGFPAKVTLRFESAQPTTLRIELADAGAKGAALRAVLNGQPLAEERWSLLTLPPGEQAPKRPRTISSPLPVGTHELVLENVGGEDWVELAAIDLGARVPVIAAVGKRSEDFAALWIWRQDGVFAEHTPALLNDGTFLLENIGPGPWQITWWDSLKGVPGPTQAITHGGGTLRISIPPISRHLALIVER
jgi:hypothetical protein